MNTVVINVFLLDVRLSLLTFMTCLSCMPVIYLYSLKCHFSKSSCDCIRSHKHYIKCSFFNGEIFDTNIVIKWKTKNTTLSWHFRNSLEKSLERGNIDTPNTQIHKPLTFLAGYKHFNKKLRVFAKFYDGWNNVFNLLSYVLWDAMSSNCPVLLNTITLLLYNLNTIPVLSFKRGWSK